MRNKKKKENKINKPLDQQNLINECQQKVAAMKISIYLLELNVLLLFSAVDSLHLSFARSLVNRMQCCNKHRAKGFHFHVKHTHTHTYKFSAYETQIKCHLSLCAVSASEHAYMKQSNEKVEGDSVQKEKNKPHTEREHTMKLHNFLSLTIQFIQTNLPVIFTTRTRKRKKTHEQKQPNGKQLLECQFTVHSNFGKL